MNIFEHEGKKFISINGKDYFLLRAYQLGWNRFIFVQVAGKTPLNKEDMPTKDWEIIRTKVGNQRVWTAYAKAYFKYESEKEEQRLAFLGASTEGSYFLALKHIARRFNLNYEDKELLKIAKRHASSEGYHRYLERESDKGNSRVDLVLVNFDWSFKEDNAKEFIEGHL